MWRKSQLWSWNCTFRGAARNTSGCIPLRNDQQMQNPECSTLFWTRPTILHVTVIPILQKPAHLHYAPTVTQHVRKVVDVLLGTGEWRVNPLWKQMRMCRWIELQESMRTLPQCSRAQLGRAAKFSWLVVMLQRLPYKEYYGFMLAFEMEYCLYKEDFCLYLCFWNGPLKLEKHNIELLFWQLNLANCTDVKHIIVVIMQR